MPNTRWLTATACLLLAPSVVFAQEPVSEGPGLRFELLVGAWIPRIIADASLGPGGTRINLDDQLGLGSAEATFNGELTMRIGDRWLLRGSGFDYSVDTFDSFQGTARLDGLTLTNGDPFSAELDITSYAVEGGFVFWQPVPDEFHTAPQAVRLQLSVLVAGRYLEIEQTVDQIGVGTARGSGDWVGVLGGLELNVEVELPRSWPVGRALRLDVSGAAGADVDNGGFMSQVAAGFTLEFNDHLGVMLGYRLIEVDLSDGNYDFDGGLQGLFLAGQLRF